MDILTAPQTWLIVGTEMFNDEQPEDDDARREQFARSFVRTTSQNLVVIYRVPQTLELLDERIDQGDVQWIYVSEDKQRFRFAALSLPAFTNDRGQELAAVAVVSTRKYKTGREGATRALCLAIAETLGSADQQRIWIEVQHAVAHTDWPRYWMVFWSVGRGTLPRGDQRHTAELEDVLAHPDDPRVWYAPSER
jgi:hypothetical protein